MINEHKKGVKAVKYTTKPRNFVAKNATSAGAGAHKDKKKAVKQGNVKHKKAEFAESYEARLTRRLEEATVNSQFINVQVTKILAREAQRMTNAPIEQLLAPLMKEYNLTLQQINSMVPGGLKKAAGEYGVMVKAQGVAEGFFGDIKQSFATGMVDKLKKAIPAQYHKHYDFDSVKSPGDTKAIVARARAAGHLKESGVAEDVDQDKKVFKDKSGKPVGEIGIDPESSPGNGEWYVHHYATGYSVVGFDSAAEAKRELMYVHKHPDAVKGHPSTKEQGVAEGIVDTIRSKNYARLADRSADKRATALDNFDEPEHQKQTDIMKQRNLKSRLLNKKGVAEGTGPQSKLDQKIIHLLTNGIPADAIARKLDIPIAWVDEVAKYNIPDSAIDYNDPRNTPPTNRFGEGVVEGSFAHDQLKGEINDLFKPVVLQIVKWARAEGMTAKDLAGTSSHFFLDALDPDTYDRTQHLPDNYFNKLMDKANAKAVEILKKKGVAEEFEIGPASPGQKIQRGYRRGEDKDFLSWRVDVATRKIPRDKEHINDLKNFLANLEIYASYSVASDYSDTGSSGRQKDKAKAQRLIPNIKADIARLESGDGKQGVGEAVDPNAPFNYDAWSKSGKKPRKPAGLGGRKMRDPAMQRDAERSHQKKVKDLGEDYILSLEQALAATINEAANGITGPGRMRDPCESTSARDNWNKASAAREKKHDKIEADRKKAPPGSGMTTAINRLEKQLNKK